MQFHSKQILWNFKHTTLSIGAEGLRTNAASRLVPPSVRAASDAGNQTAGSAGGQRGAEGQWAALLGRDSC